MKLSLLTLAIFFICAAIMLPPTLTHANNPHYPIGQIAHIEGTGTSLKEGRSKALEENDPIFIGSTLKTDKDSRILVLFIDDTRMTLGPNSELLIDEFVFDPYDSSENHADISVNKGAFYWVSGMISKREEPDVTIRNSYGSIGIRGTAFWGGEIQNGYGVVVDEGLVHFSGPWGATALPHGASTYITQTQAIEGETFWSPENKIIAQKTVTFKMAQELEKKIIGLFKDNIRKRNDYRGQMFPYKENPFRPRTVQPEEDDEFFSDEFKDIQKRQEQGRQNQ